MPILKRAWTFVSYAAGAYAVYKQLQTLNQAKDDLYKELNPTQQEQWDKIFGKPGVVQVQNPQMPQVVIAPTSVEASPLEQLKANV